MLISRADTYEEVYDSFRWQVPEFYNIAGDVCDRHADKHPDKIALIVENNGGPVRRLTFAEIRDDANRLANWLVGQGLARGDRVSILLSQHPEAAITHIACWKAGLVSSPMSILFGPDAVAYRLRDLDTRVVVTDSENLPKIKAVAERTPGLEHILVIDGDGTHETSFRRAIEDESDQFENVRTRADDLAFINYTSGTTGNPKGSMQPHRLILGHVPSFEFLYDFAPRDGDVIWSPADWSWLAGLVNILMFGWFHGSTVLATAKIGFDPEDACRLMHEHRVTCAMLTPTMLKLLRQNPAGFERFAPMLRVVLSGTESVGKELLLWANETLKCPVNEGYGQTECNAVLGNCASVMPIKPGSLGRSLPGHRVAIVDDDGQEVAPGTVGNIAVRRPDPVMMLGYWNRPDATRDKFIGDWLITGDLASMDEDGYFWFQGRQDDIITSSGYRIGPGEVEDALLQHPSVAMVAVIGVPDPARTESIKALVVLKPDVKPDAELEQSLRDSVKARLARYEYPREIEFLDSLPMTVTGKVLRRELRERERNKIEEP